MRFMIAALLGLVVMWAVGCNVSSLSGPSSSTNSTDSAASTASASPSAASDVSSSVEPAQRAVNNPFGAAGLIQPADPLLGGGASGAGAASTGAVSASYPAPTPGYAAPAPGYSPTAPGYAPPNAGYPSNAPGHVPGSSPPGYSSAPGSRGGPAGSVPPGATAPSGYSPPGYAPAGAHTPGAAPGTASAPSDAATTRVPAQVGVGRRGRSLDQFNSGVQRVIAEPARSLFAARERLVFQVSIPQALQLFQAEKGYLPRSHEEFMREIIEYNRIPLPELPPGHRYVYDPQRGELMVERPAR